uniref:Uncharacterized protein n=1 Tax=Anguilla anguilla TaxID=7936 RepID=A0A0E9VKB7_ANGAN
MRATSAIGWFQQGNLQLHIGLNNIPMKQLA